jgi:hypothetical protein
MASKYALSTRCEQLNQLLKHLKPFFPPMKRILLLLVFCWANYSVALAQLPPGSDAPDFTVTDLDGNTWNLYQLLDEGKTVYIDFSATWCGPCWNYHNTHALANVWNTYGPPGTGEAFVFFIEGDANTNTACLYGPSGCVGGTQGDWVTDTPYPIVESHSVRQQYSVNYYPTIYMVCPANKKVYEVGQLQMQGLWNQRNNICPEMAVNVTVNNVKNIRCFDTSTGSIDISAAGGTGPYTYVWSNGATTQDLNNIPAGSYSCTVTSSNGWMGITDPIEVEGPSEDITIAVTDQTPVGCNGVLASVTVEANGGWPGGYNYRWNNGQLGETAISLSSGNYTVSATDQGGCTKTLTVNVPPPTYPTASIAQPGTITCVQPSLQLNATNSSMGGDFVYQWFAANGGNIVSGGTTLTPTVNAAGSYTLQVTNTATNCISYATVVVSSNISLPDANAGAPGVVSCAQPSIQLQGSGSSGPNITYLWTASNGGNITAGGTTLTPTVNAGGTYTLQVTNTTTGCTKTSSTTVSGNNTPPSVSTTNGVITCANNNVTLTTSTNSGNPTFAWTGPNGYASNLQSPNVNASGTYNLVLTDTVTGCSNTATANVTTNTAAPGASASGGALTCVINSVTLSGASPDTAATFAWTGPNGFTSNLQNPSVNAAGQYVLTTTNPANGCTSSANATVALNNTPPTASAATPGNLNCNTSQLQLNGTGSSQGANFTYQWTTTNGNIVSGGNTLTPLIDAVGTYNLLVSNTDNGCTSTASTNVAQSAAVTAAIGSQTNVSCNGASNGAATATPGGGNGTYNFAWSNGATTASVSNVAAGTYLVTVTDGENCTASSAVTITQPDLLVVNASATAQTSNGINDGTATANPTGGTSGYAYLWSNSATNQTINDLAPGNYTVTVTDQNGCTAVQTVTVNSFNCALSASISGTNVTCFAANNGTAEISLIGAADPVLYEWSNGAATQSVSGLTPGLYTVNVTDANNCPASLNINIAEPAELHANATSTHESAAGANDGTATANPTGGTSGYTYLWSNGDVTQTVNNLAPGSYTVSVTDQNGCTAVQTVAVNSFNCAIAVEPTVSNVTCAGANNGSVALALNGGTAPFDYVWSNGGTAASISNLSGGTYTATVTDANDCQVIVSSTVNEPAPYSDWTVETTSPVCVNEATGTATVSISGGTGPYNFVWSNGQTSNTAANLTAGNYTVSVTDQNGCQSNTSVSITAQDNVPPTVSVQNATVTLNASGTAEVTLTALTAQLADNCGVASSSISPNSFNCSQLGSHEVTVVVTDQSGLTATATATVTVLDNSAPTVSCPANLTRCAADNLVNYDAPVAVDNCLGNGGEWKLENGLESGAIFPIGTTTQTYSYTDAGGNIGACSFSVTVVEQVGLDDLQVTNDLNNQGVGSIDITVSGGTGPYTFEWTHEGQVVGATEDLAGLSAGDYTVVITDANGCFVKKEDIHVDNTVGAPEPAWLKGVRLQPNPTSGLTRVVFSQPLSASLEISVIDATGRVLLTDISEGQFEILLDCSHLPDGLYALRFRTGTESGVKKLVVSH